MRLEDCLPPLLRRGGVVVRVRVEEEGGCQRGRRLVRWYVWGVGERGGWKRGRVRVEISVVGCFARIL